MLSSKLTYIFFIYFVIFIFKRYTSFMNDCYYTIKYIKLKESCTESNVYIYIYSFVKFHFFRSFFFLNLINLMFTSKQYTIIGRKKLPITNTLIPE